MKTTVLTLLMLSAACGADTSKGPSAAKESNPNLLTAPAPSEAPQGPCQPGYVLMSSTGKCVLDIEAQVLTLASSNSYRNVGGATVQVHNPNNLFFTFHVVASNKSPVLAHVQFGWVFSTATAGGALTDAFGGIPTDMAANTSYDGSVVFELPNSESTFEAAFIMTPVSDPQFIPQGWDIGSVPRIPWCTNNHPCGN